MSPYHGRREFTAGPGMITIMILVTLLFVAGAPMTYRQRGWTWVSLGLAGATILGVGGLIESLILRVQLTDHALVLRDLGGRRLYSRAEIRGVDEAKGVPTTVLLADGRWVRLPSVGSSLGNSIRSWLRADSP